MNNIGTNLKKYREHNSFTQKELAEYFGCPREMISYYENGNRTPNIEFLLKISDLFGVELNELMEESSDVVNENLVLAFRIGENTVENIDAIVSFKKIIKNYLKMSRLLTQNGL